MEKARFLHCPKCGTLLEVIEEHGFKPSCCGQEMEPLLVGVGEGDPKVHVPLIIEKDGKVLVRVGAIPHPMSEEHHIAWIYLHTDRGIQRKELRPGQPPEAVFTIPDREIVFAAYAYCNRHGLFQAEAE